MNYHETQKKIDALDPKEFEQFKFINYGAAAAAGYSPNGFRDSWIKKSRKKRALSLTCFVGSVISAIGAALMIGNAVLHGWHFYPIVFVVWVVSILALYLVNLADEESAEVHHAVHIRDKREGNKHKNNEAIWLSAQLSA